jgi:hypothetical protein
MSLSLLDLGETETTNFTGDTDYGRKSPSLGHDFFVPEEFWRSSALNSLALVLCEICAICGLSLIPGFGLA